jgi:hypothetical protein
MCSFNPNLLESLIYMLGITAVCALVAFLLYRGVKSGGKAKGAGLTLGPFNLSFELTGAIAGFLITLVIWLYALPPSTVLPPVMVYSVDAKLDMKQFSPAQIERIREGSGITVAVIPGARVLENGKIDGLYVVAAKNLATNTWDIPSIVLTPKPPLDEQFNVLNLSTEPNILSNDPEPTSLSIIGRTLKPREKITLPMLKTTLEGGS